VRTPVARFLSFGVAIALAYVASAYVGFRLAVVAEQITTVWAPTGIALAAVLLGGVRVWPAIWLGAFAANASTTAPLWTALVIATGNTLEAAVAAWALARIPGFDAAFRRVADVLAFVVIAALACTTISATVGVATLCVAGVQSWTRFGDLWFDWWLGDALGAIIIAPAILTTARARWERPDAIKAVAFAGASLVITQLVFGRVLGTNPHPLEYVIFPLIVAAAVTSGPAVTSLTVLGASALTIWHTVNGSGPFAGSELHERLILVQVFMGVLAGTAFLLAAATHSAGSATRASRFAKPTPLFVRTATSCRWPCAAAVWARGLAVSSPMKCGGAANSRRSSAYNPERSAVRRPASSMWFKRRIVPLYARPSMRPSTGGPTTSSSSGSDMPAVNGDGWRAEAERSMRSMDRRGPCTGSAST
jgi:integral membrane sensor domain MASE1